MGKNGSKACTACLGCCFPTSFLLGVVCIGGAVAFYLEFPNLLTSQVNERVTLEKGHATYEQLQNPTINIYKKFYFFNWTNYDEFIKSEGSVAPKVEEKGPYSFKEKRTKKFIKTCDEDKLNYTQTKVFHFDPITSGDGLSDSDIIYTINIPYVAAISEVRNNLVKRDFLKYWIVKRSKAKIYIRQNATALAWGYSDKFVRELHFYRQYPLDIVSIQANDSTEDQKISTINTGVSNISEVGQYSQWDGQSQLHIWYGPDANKIRGTEGFFFKPNLNRNDILTAYVDDVMRSFDLRYVGTVDHLGLEAFRYGIDNTTFRSAFNEPKNAQFGSWCPDGMFYLGPTQVKEIPVYGSKPHFLDGDPDLLDSVVGLNPDREKHDTVIDVEHITGANIYFKKQLQVNVQVNTTTHFDFLKKIKGYRDTGVLYMPVLYVCESAEIDEAFKDYLEGKGLHLVEVFEVLVPVIFALLIVCGAILILVGVLTCIAWVRRVKAGLRGSELTPLLDNNN